MLSGEYRISTSTLVIYWAVFNQESDPLDEPMTQRSHDKECTLEKLSLKYARKQQNILKVTENNFNTTDIQENGWINGDICAIFIQ